MKVTYLHGLESKQGGPKVEFLQQLVTEVYVPAMDYRRGAILFNEVLEGSVGSSLVVGSSMGGWFAYLLATRLGVPSLLFNPAVHSRSIEFEIGAGSHHADQHVVLGAHDTVIDPSRTRDWFDKHAIGRLTYHFYEGGHRVPFEVFESWTKARLASIRSPLA